MLIRDNKYIPIEDKDFFILLRIGLWQKVEEPLSNNPDWEYIYNLSIEQTVQGLIADGIGIYRKEHPELNISQQWNDKFLSASAQIVRRNFAINNLQAKICKLFNEQGVTYVIMKGQVVAQNYPKPNLRCSGDIDFFLDTENYEEAKKLLEPIATNQEEEHSYQKHKAYYFNELEVELHGEEMKALEMDEIFNHGLYEILRVKDNRKYCCNGIPVQLAPATFETTYSFLHFIKHYCLEGISIRQLCDIFMLLHKQREVIESEQLKNNIVQYKLNLFWNTFLHFGSQYIGCSNEEIKFYEIPVGTKQGLMYSFIRAIYKPVAPKDIWTRCKEKGNFGHNVKQESTNNTQSFLQRNLHEFKRANQRLCQTIPVSIHIAVHQYMCYIGKNFNKVSKKLYYKDKKQELKKYYSEYSI